MPKRAKKRARRRRTAADPQQQEVNFDDYAGEDEDFQIGEYDVTATPNDFNITTIYNFIESGAVVIPGFQRNYVWDIKRASKLIESLILGLPVPQLFLYEQDRNKFLVIDGQQRLMSIYYFMKQRFPRKEKRGELRAIFEQHAHIPDETLQDDSFFTKFNLALKDNLPNQPNMFKGLNYATLGEHKTQFDLRPIRNIIVRQSSPKDDDSSIYEIFSRLNSGGMNLTPQEIRISLYHSEFYDTLYRINVEPEWRRLLNAKEPSLHAKDVEVLLRGFAMLVASEEYAPSMTKFLNAFSQKTKHYNESTNAYLESLFKAFLEACSDLDEDAFLNKKNRRFNIALFEAVFAAACERSFKARRTPAGKLDGRRLAKLETDSKFQAASLQGTTQTVNVRARLERARAIVGSL